MGLPQEETSRFSDTRLFQFHEDFMTHVSRCEERFNDSDARFTQLIDAQQKNTDAISTLIEETREVVQLHKDIQGTTRIAKSLQSFGIWLVKWPLIGGGLYAAFTQLIKHFPIS